MTIEELRSNIDEGREWLKAHGFKTADSIDEYFGAIRWTTYCVEIWEPDESYVESLKLDSPDNGWAWMCCVDLDEDWDCMIQTKTYGITPGDALRESLKEWDEEMDRRRRTRFGAILEEE